MKQRIIFFALMLFIAVGVIAQPATIGSSNRNIPVRKHHRMKSVNSGIKKAVVKITKSGEVVLTENFSGFAAGSEASPNMTDIFDEDGYIPDNMTQTPGWWGYGVYQAGGKAYMGFGDFGGEDEETGYLESSALEFSSEATVNISIKIKSANTDGDLFVIEWYDWDTEVFGSDGVEITNSWDTYNISLPEVIGTEVYLCFYAYDFECFIDDIEVTTEGGSGSSALFFEDCGTTAPSSNPRPATAAYTGWRNYGVDNITGEITVWTTLHFPAATPMYAQQAL